MYAGVLKHGVKLLYFLHTFQPTPFQGYSMISNSDSSASSHGGYEPAPQEDQQKSIEAKRQQLYMESLRRTEVAKQVPAVSGDTDEESAMRQQLEKQQEDITRLKVAAAYKRVVVVVHTLNTEHPHTVYCILCSR